MSSHKQELRRQMKQLRGSLGTVEKAAMDAAMRDAFLQLPGIRKANMVYCYVSYGSEIDTYGLIRELLVRQIAVAVPRVTGQQLQFYRITGLDQLRVGYRGIPEPSKDCSRAEDLCAPVLTPGLVFAEDGKRIGYGGGFYDRFFMKEPEHTRIAMAYPFQITDAVPQERLDQRVHIIITPDRAIETGA